LVQTGQANNRIKNLILRNSTNHSFKINTIKLWSAQTISATGDAVYQLALVWIILDMTGSTAVTGVVAMSAYLPAILFGVLAGVLADRHNRMKLMLISNFSQAITVAVIPILLFSRNILQTNTMDDCFPRYI